MLRPGGGNPPRPRNSRTSPMAAGTTRVKSCNLARRQTTAVVCDSICWARMRYSIDVTRSGAQPLAPPRPIGPAGEQQPVVQAVGPALPEFNHLGHDAITAPVDRPRHVPAGVLVLQLREPPVDA